MTAARASAAPTWRPARLRAVVRDPWLFGAFVLLTAPLVLFSAVPILGVLRQAAWSGAAPDLPGTMQALADASAWRALGNTLLLGATSGVVATLTGFALAFAVTRTSMPGKGFIHAVALLPVVSPPFVMALAIVILFGRQGLISKGLLGITGANVYGFRSLVLIQVLAFTPIAYLNIRGMLQAMNSALDDASASLGGTSWMTFRRVTLPLVTPAILSSFLLVFVKSLEDFGNPMIIGGNFNTLAVEAYSHMVGYFDLRTGALLACVLLTPSLLAFVLHRYWISRRSYVTVTGKPGAQRIRLTSRRVVWPLGTICYALAGTIILFYATVVAVSFMRLPGVDASWTLDHYRTAFTAGFETLHNSMLLAGAATPITAVAGMLIAFLLVRRAFPGAALLKWSTMLSFAAPGTILGIGYISVFNEPPLVLTGTAFLIVTAMVVKNLQVGIEAGSNQLKQIDPAIEEASSALGASSTRTFLQVTMPLLRPALFTALAYAFTRSLTTLSAVVFLVSAQWTLITVTILSHVETLKIGLAAAYCVILIVVVLAVLAAMQAALALRMHRT
ncbi:MAG: iron ABC transporter permease [Alphaproteobacteria bacterium]|nr:iron ABC transporter permease [Alphaproteobacteria bacterium]